jgi:malate dehydrogenase
MCFGVPVKLGRKGVEEIIQIKLNPEEKATLEKSAALIRSTMAHLT